MQGIAIHLARAVNVVITYVVDPAFGTFTIFFASKSLICLAWLDLSMKHLTPQDVATCLVKKPGRKNLKIFC